MKSALSALQALILLPLSASPGRLQPSLALAFTSVPVPVSVPVRRKHQNQSLLSKSTFTRNIKISASLFKMEAVVSTSSPDASSNSNRSNGDIDNGKNGSSQKIRLIWHRRDLRLHDNELYCNLGNVEMNTTNNDSGSIDTGKDRSVSLSHKEDGGTSTACVSLFVFDNQYFQLTKSSIGASDLEKKKNEEKNIFHTVWCGPHGAQAFIEAVTSLRTNIRSIGGELLVRQGDPAVIVPQIAEEIGAHEIYFQEEPGSYECRVANKIKQHYTFQQDYAYGYSGDSGCCGWDFDFDSSPVQLVSTVGYTLYHPNDLPSHAQEWDQLAHPKQKHKKKKKKKNNNNNNQQQHTKLSMESPTHLNLVDVSTDRFKGMSRIMGDFRKAARGSSQAPIRGILEKPHCLMTPHGFDVKNLKGGDGDIPTLEDLMQHVTGTSILGLEKETIEFVVNSTLERRDVRNQNNLICSETQALKRLESFLADGCSTADRSLADVSDNNSSRLSVHLALGTLSPRTIYWKTHDSMVKHDSDGDGEEDNRKWLQSHLEMRDFFLFTAFASGDKLYQQKGLPVSKKQMSVEWNNPQDDSHIDTWKRWANGSTELPMVDAAMRELMSTGYCSNRVRQNVASVLTKDLKLDWRVGAEWFQFLLEDHCVGANYGNWLYFSGVGPDPKNRHFRTISQSKRYDGEGKYAKKWIPALADVDDIESILRPWDFDITGFESPLVDPASQYTWQDLQLLKENGQLMVNPTTDNS